MKTEWNVLQQPLSIRELLDKDLDVVDGNIVYLLKTESHRIISFIGRGDIYDPKWFKFCGMTWENDPRTGDGFDYLIPLKENDKEYIICNNSKFIAYRESGKFSLYGKHRLDTKKYSYREYGSMNNFAFIC